MNAAKRPSLLFSHNSAWLTWSPPPLPVLLYRHATNRSGRPRRAERKMQGGWERKGSKTRQTAAEKRILAEGIWMKEQRARRRMSSDLTGYSPFLSTFQKESSDEIDQVGISKHLVNKDVSGEQNPEGESVAKCNRDKQMKAGNVGDW